MAALIELGRQFAIEPDPLALLQRVCDASRDMTLAESAIVGILSETGDEVRACLSSGLAGVDLSAFAPDLQRSTILGPMLETRRSVRRINPNGDPAALELPDGHPSVFSYLGVPIASPTRVYGWLGLANKVGATAFSEADEQVAGLLAVQAAVAYENAVRFQTLRETEERTEFALRAARIGVWERDLVSGRVTYSDGMSLVFGRPLDQLPSRWPD
ncbi:MAG: GAF domain-containing protein, partial [Acidobacteriota bacterium]